jgi:hypothetical protein
MAWNLPLYEYSHRHDPVVEGRALMGTQQSTRVMDIPLGAQVKTSDGVPLGTIAEVWAHSPSHGVLPKSQYTLASYGPISGTEHLVNPHTEGHLQVVTDSGLETRRELSVPLQAVDSVEPGGQVVLKYTADEAARRHSPERERDFQSRLDNLQKGRGIL